MAVRKATRSNLSTQPQPSNHQLKAEIFEALRHLNRGYGVALAALDRLESKDRLRKPSAFAAGFLHVYRNQTEALRAQTNRDLLRLIAGREEQDVARFSQPTRPKPKQRF